MNKQTPKPGDLVVWVGNDRGDETYWGLLLGSCKIVPDHVVVYYTWKTASQWHLGVAQEPSSWRKIKDDELS